LLDEDGSGKQLHLLALGSGSSGHPNQQVPVISTGVVKEAVKTRVMVSEPYGYLLKLATVSGSVAAPTHSWTVRF